MAFDFGRIGETVSRFMDTDYIDIKRDVDGKLLEVYSNIPCHVSYAATDNPDPNTVDTKPIIQSLSVNISLWADVRNNDFIVAKKVGSDGSLIATYSGRCGNPVVSQGRKKFLMQMSGTENDEPTPLPPKESALITVSYYSDGTAIQDEIKQKVEIGKAFEMGAPVIEGYSAEECYIDGELQESTEAKIDEVKESGHEIRFVYSVSDIPDFFRFLVNGLYTKDNGSLANGWHLYKKINIDSIEENENLFTITCDDVEMIHTDSRKTLFVDVGVKMVLIPGDVFVEVSEISRREGGKVTFTAVRFEPTEKERSAYVCGWYD